MARRPNVIGNGAKLMGAAGSGAPVVFLVSWSCSLEVSEICHLS